MAAKPAVVQALEINASLVGALFTDQSETHLRVFCYYLSGATSEFTVPLDENLDSLNHLFARLDMLGQCTSVILEKSVQGRLYVEQNNRLLSYTLLNTPGAAPLPIGGDVCNLPWRRVWASGEAEILQLKQRGHSARRYAVRSPVNEAEAISIYRNSHAFLRPTVPPHKAFQRIATPALLLILLGITLSIGGSGFAWWRLRHPKRPDPVHARPMSSLAPSRPHLSAHMLHDRQITGPFTAAELDRMVADRQLPESALFRIQGTSDWVPYQVLTLTPAKP